MRLIALTALVATLVGCAAPRVITSITGSENEMKFIYARAGLFSAETGLLRCDRAGDGSLSNCKNIPITFEEGS